MGSIAFGRACAFRTKNNNCRYTHKYYILRGVDFTQGLPSIVSTRPTLPPLRHTLQMIAVLCDSLELPAIRPPPVTLKKKKKVNKNWWGGCVCVRAHSVGETKSVRVAQKRHWNAKKKTKQKEQEEVTDSFTVWLLLCVTVAQSLPFSARSCSTLSKRGR